MFREMRKILTPGAIYLYTVWLVVSFLLAGLQGDLLQWRWPALAFLLGGLAQLSREFWFPDRSRVDSYETDDSLKMDDPVDTL